MDCSTSYELNGLNLPHRERDSFFGYVDKEDTEAGTLVMPQPAAGGGSGCLKRYFLMTHAEEQ